MKIIIPLGFNILFFTLVWFYAKSKDRYLIADLAWSLAIPINFLIFYALTDRPLKMLWIVLAMNVVWGVRLALVLYRRFRSGHEDRRYTNMKKAWGTEYANKFFGFFMLQALVAWLFVVPFYGIFQSNTIDPFFTGLGVVIFCLSLFMEWLADHQVEVFKQNTKVPKSFCQEGLWKYSAHPNYFFEWCTWIGMAISAMAFEYGIYAWLVVGMELFLILKVSGIPFTEQVMLESRGDAYKDYLVRTSSFFPWPPKRSK